MKNMLLATLALGTFFVPILCSENGGEASDALVLKVKLQGKFEDGSRKLTLLGADKVVQVSRIFPTAVRYQDQPFFPVIVQKQEDLVRVKCLSHENCIIEKERLEILRSRYCNEIQHLPWKYFLDPNNGFDFEPHGAELYSVKKDDGEGHSLKLELQFDSDLKQDETLGMYFDAIGATPSYYPEDKKDLINCLFLKEKEDGKIVYGIRSFFADSQEIAELEKKVEKWKLDAESKQRVIDGLNALLEEAGEEQEKWQEGIKQAELKEKSLIASLQSSLRNYRIGLGISGGLFAMIMLYIFRDILHDKIYATV